MWEKVPSKYRTRNYSNVTTAHLQFPSPMKNSKLQPNPNKPNKIPVSVRINSLINPVPEQSHSGMPFVRVRGCDRLLPMVHGRWPKIFSNIRSFSWKVTLTMKAFRRTDLCKCFFKSWKKSIPDTDRSFVPSHSWLNHFRGVLDQALFFETTQSYRSSSQLY